MRKTFQQRKEAGFTIIEVLIVLAIAGLIMVVVFLAVPALQRSGRNNALNTDANNIFTGVNNYVSNNNGTLPGAVGLAGTTVTIKPASGTANNESVTVDGSVTAISIIGSTGTPIDNTAAIGTVQVVTGTTAKCNSTKSGLSGTASSRAVAVLYVAESGSGNIVKCLD